jgi:hypothetical protein
LNDITRPSDGAPADAAATPRGLAPEVLERLIYFVGPTRGGTGIIARSFFLSDPVFSFPKYVQFTKNIWRYRWTIKPQVLHRLFKLPAFYREQEVLELLPLTARRKVQQRIRAAFAARHMGRMYQLYPLIYALDPACEKDLARVRCWADKANDTYSLFAMPRYLPKAKFVFIARDPRAVIASAQRQSLMATGEEESATARFPALVASSIYWRNMMQTLLRFAHRYPDRTMFVRYEDFVAAPETTINEILDFAVGERVSTETLHAGLQQFPHPRKHDRSAEGVGIDQRPLSRWRRMMSEAEIVMATAFTWRTGRKLGYDIGPVQGKIAAVRAVARLKGWRRRVTAAAKLAYLELMEKSTPALPVSRTAGVIGSLPVGMTHDQRLAQARWIARIMDDNFAIPGTKFRFGWDAILGLFPGLGDAVTSVVSLVIVHHAWRTGTPPITLARMLGNVGIDLVLGSVPVLGDAFDLVWKANRKNAALLERHLHEQHVQI